MSRPNFGHKPETPKAPAAPAPDPEKVRQFLEGGTPKSTPDEESRSSSPAAIATPVSKGKPWENQDDTARGRSPGSVFNMRFTDREHACLEVIRKKTPFSKHAFVIAALRPALVAKIKELTGEDISELLRQPEEE